VFVISIDETSPLNSNLSSILLSLHLSIILLILTAIVIIYLNIRKSIVHIPKPFQTFRWTEYLYSDDGGGWDWFRENYQRMADEERLWFSEYVYIILLIFIVYRHAKRYMAMYMPNAGYGEYIALSRHFPCFPRSIQIA
jgi:hypothetical protein